MLYTWSDHMPSHAMEKLFGYSTRKPESKIYKHHRDIAASLQVKLEEVVFTSHISDDELLILYNMCHLFVFPSWLQHMVYPFFGKGERRIVASNLNCWEVEPELAT